MFINMLEDENGKVLGLTKVQAVDIAILKMLEVFRKHGSRDKKLGSLLMIVLSPEKVPMLMNGLKSVNNTEVIFKFFIWTIVVSSDKSGHPFMEEGKITGHAIHNVVYVTFATENGNFSVADKIARTPLPIISGAGRDDTLPKAPMGFQPSSKYISEWIGDSLEEMSGTLLFSFSLSFPHF